MTFLSWLAEILINVLLKKLIDWGKAIWDRVSTRKKIEEQSDASVRPLKDAKTGEEIDKATSDALNHF